MYLLLELVTVLGYSCHQQISRYELLGWLLRSNSLKKFRTGLGLEHSEALGIGV